MDESGAIVVWITAQGLDVVINFTRCIVEDSLAEDGDFEEGVVLLQDIQDWTGLLCIREAEDGDKQSEADREEDSHCELWTAQDCMDF